MTAALDARRPLRPLAAEATFVHRSILHSLRNSEALLMAVLLPTLLMLLFTFVFGGAFAIEGAYVDYVVPGIILLCAGFGAASTAVSVSLDMTTGIIDRFRTMPIRGWAVLTGHVVASLLRNLLATGIVIGVAFAVGFRPSGDALAWAAALGLVALYILAVTVLFAAIGLAASGPDAANGYGFVLLFAPYLSSAFVPVETMPEWLRWIAHYQPITPIIETLRALLLGGPGGGSASDGFAALLWCGLILALAVAWGAWLFPRKAARR